MHRPPSRRLAAAIVASAGLVALVPAAAGTAAPAPAATGADRQQQFAAAAARHHVPLSVLLGVSYLESRWDAHVGQPSSAGGYGPMHLTEVTRVAAPAARGDARGDDARPMTTPAQPSRTTDDPALHTMDAAAALTGASTATLQTDPAANIDAGAALLADYQRQLGASGSDAAVWYGAVARYSGATDAAGAREFADEVYQVIRTGETRRTDSGDTVRLAAQPSVAPKTGQLSALHLSSAKAETGTPTPECPSSMDCDFVPAAYAQNSADKGDYGNYDLADRPSKLKIQYIVIHDNEGYYNGTLSWFQNPAAYAAAHYELRSSDGHVTQMIQNTNVAWQAGNWYINAHSIGIEHEGFAATGATWYTEAMYRQSAKLVRYLAAKYRIPLDRQHIIGHDNVPATTAGGIKNMHWDPGPYWDWNHYMNLVRGHAQRPGRTGGLVTISPDFATNQQPVTGCDKSGSGTPCDAQGTNFVYLHTQPSADSPLVSDPGLHAGPGTTDIADWAARAVDGQQFALAGRHGDWTAIWYAGVKGWFLDPHRSPTATAAHGFVVTPKRGATVPIYGKAYPEASAYDGTPVPVQSVTDLGYTMTGGQRYPLGLTNVVTDYYYAPTIDSSLPGDHTVVVGHDRYYEIQFGHRIGFVRADAVTIRPV
jgi:hypothetical protein